MKAVGAGKSLLDNRAAQVLMDRLRKEAEQTVLLRDLSATERAMLALLGEGLTNREIGQRMFLAEKTVKITSHAFCPSSVSAGAPRQHSSAPNGAPPRGLNAIR